MGKCLRIAAFAVAVCFHSLACGQEAPPAEDEGGPSAVRKADDAAPAPAFERREAGRAEDEAGLQFVSLLIKGGWFMIPIALLSLLTVTVTLERLISMRRGRVLPARLVESLGRLGSSGGGFDPREAYRVCQENPSVASNVIRAMLLKVGRPHTEVEHAVSEASEREAEKMYANVRWLALAAAVAPLLGLLGTVWGMIRAFHDTTQMVAAQNRFDYLAGGIYVALVTTFAGLAVAIPAAIAAHWFEGRIQTLFHEVDEMLFNLLPNIEKFEGRVRFSRRQAEASAAEPRAESGETRQRAASPK